MIRLLPSTLCIIMVWYNKLGIVHFTYQGVSGYNFKKNCIFCQDISYLNSVDPNELLHYEAFHLGLLCKSTHWGVSRIQRVKSSLIKVILAFALLECIWIYMPQTSPVRKRPAGIQVNLNTWNLKKNTGGFFFPSHEMEYRWKAI